MKIDKIDKANDIKPFLIERIVSSRWTPNHIDVTDKPISYSKPKEFKFPPKKQIQWIDLNRWFRQKSGVNRKVVSVHELTSMNNSIDNRINRNKG